uniref:Uncharacterized protein n=1 Tax=Arundo donax TaxID=35708 RepID=A0A0A8YP46_ARUDO
MLPQERSSLWIPSLATALCGSPAALRVAAGGGC